jgi:hypothetical protein
VQVALNSILPPLTLEDPSIQMPLVPDGVLGTETAKAVKAFQRRWQLGDDGVAGPGTLSFLFADQPLFLLIQLCAGRVVRRNLQTPGADLRPSCT